ncbi:hypothetical protein [Paraburkholderia sp. CI3]|uniref:hypothetical protein n=1 Tax=Paraburkholderia sp. CI3 TaxID=2991060 RepID=UPI003D1B6AD1
MRRLVGYGRLQGLEATEALASLYQVSRLYINFFQPSFKLKSKTRHGAKVTKHYESPLTPVERVLHSASVPEATKRKLRARFRALDPLDLLRRMRQAQQQVSKCNECGTAPAETQIPNPVALAEFLVSLGTAWQDGEVRPTHERKARVPHTWRSREGRSSTRGRRSSNGSNPWHHSKETARAPHRTGTGDVLQRAAAHLAAPRESMEIEPCPRTSDPDTRQRRCDEG